MTSSNAETVNSLTLDMQYKLWNQRLGHPDQHALRLVSDACDWIPNLQRHPLFKCGDFIAGKLHRYKKGQNNKNATPKPGESFQMDCGFVRGKKFYSAELNEIPSNEVNPQTMPLKPCRNSYN